MASSPINIFQKLMRKWEAVHPYNAAQAMKVAVIPDPNAIQGSWRETIVATGLGQVRVDGNQYRFESLNGHLDACTVAFPAATLCDHISAELNRPFLDPGEPPFRPFMIAEGEHFYMGVIYQHWLADSASIRILLHEWFVRLYDPAAASARPLRLPTDGYWSTIGPHRGGWEVSQSTLGMIRRHTRLQRAQKISSDVLTDHQTRFALFPAPDGLITYLRTYAQANGVKINDIFLAALAEACARHVPLQRRPSRSDVAVGSIVDLRPFCPADLSNTFGVFLGFTNVVCHQEELKDFDRLLRIVSNQTKLQKSTGVAPSSLIWMGAAMLIGRLSKPEELYHFYRKELPLAGGISNVDLTKTWIAQYHPAPLLEYIRVSPSGPMTPLVITTTTLGEKFHVGLTHRVGLIPPERASAVANTFLQRLQSLKCEAPAHAQAIAVKAP